MVTHSDHATLTTGSRIRPVAGWWTLSRVTSLLAVFVVLAVLVFPASGMAATKRHVSLGPFGGAGGPSFEEPTSLAVDPATHDLLVFEQGDGSISRWHADGTAAEFTATGTNKIEGLESGSFYESQIAVAPPGSAGGTAGDIYVAEIYLGAVAVFGPEGESLGELTESSEGAFGEVCGVAVDGDGDLYVGDYESGIHKFAPSQGPLTAADNVANFAFPEACNLAAGAGPTEGDLFATTYGGLVKKLDATSGASLGEVASLTEVVLAADPDSGALLVGSGAEGILEYGASDSTAVLQSSIATEGAPHGLAVDPGSGRIYASEKGSDRVSVYSAYAYFPEVITTAASDREPTTAQLNGKVNPESEPLTECFFEYGPTTAYGLTAPCAEPDAAGVGSGESFVLVHAEASGLEIPQTYHYRLVAANAHGTVRGADQVVGAAGPGVGATTVSRLGSDFARLEGEVDPGGHPATYWFQYLPESAWLANGESFEGASPPTSVPAGGAAIGSGSGPVTVSEQLIGLAPGAAYRARLVAMSAGVTVAGPAVAFTTYVAALTGLPDDRAYEQASPVNKNGGNVQGGPGLIQASTAGDEIIFYSSSGLPGGEGAQEFPLFLASRSTLTWSTRGLQPGQNAGAIAKVVGWPEDLSRDYVRASNYGEAERLYERSTTTGALRQIMEPGARPLFAGASADGDVSLFEMDSATLPGAAGGGAPNLYVWDAKSGTLRLGDVLNDGVAPAEGAFAGSYAWFGGGEPTVGGAAGGQYTAPLHAISADGSHLWFTIAGGGRLYVRLNPTAPQSPLNSTGECTVSTDACTLEASESEKTNGSGPEGHDAAGRRPAAFMGATPDGSVAFFTSPEKLTNDATTAPEASPEIARAGIGGGGAEEAGFLPTTASGIAAGGGYLYWADGTAGTIGRAKLNGAGAATEVEDEFITGAAEPQYVAVDGEHVYWTNAAGGGEGEGTIGRARLNGTEVEDKFITGASDPQGIGVDAGYVFWANAGTHAIARAEIDGGSPEQALISTGAETPAGVAADSSHVYWTANRGNGVSFVVRAELDGAGETFHFDGAKLAGIALEGGHVYWVRQSAESIGRAEADLSGFEAEFVAGIGNAKGLTVDPEHLYWSTDGELEPNKGDDLYRFEAAAPKGHRLTDLTVDHQASDPNGAEVQGVLGTSEDGSYVYFAANGVLAQGAARGDCQRGEPSKDLGECNLYLWHDGAVTFVSQLDLGKPQASGDGYEASDAWDWAPREGSYVGADRASRVSADGRTLVFRSQAKLTSYDNHGQAEFYRWTVGGRVACITCDPSGAGPIDGATLSTIRNTPAPEGGFLSFTRNLSASGRRFFFESPDKLVAGDTNGDASCPELVEGARELATGIHSCQDVYEWEAPEPSNATDTCTTGSAQYVPAAEGCLFLISSGTSPEPSFFADASANGDDAFFFTSQGLVGQDTDELQDVYDARVGGGLASQNPTSSQPCGGEESCRGQAAAPGPSASPGSFAFVGPANQKPSKLKKCAKGKVKRHGKCVRQHKKKHHHHTRDRQQGKRQQKNKRKKRAAQKTHGGAK